MIRTARLARAGQHAAWVAASIPGIRLASGPYIELAQLVEQGRARYAQTSRGLLDAAVDIREHGTDVLTLGPIANLRERCQRGRVRLGHVFERLLSLFHADVAGVRIGVSSPALLRINFMVPSFLYAP